MPSKTVQIGVRIPQEDAEFIAQLTVEGASTPSDKLRAIIANARKREHGAQSYAESLNYMDELLGPVRSHVRELEHQQKRHSELVARTLEWLAEMNAFCLASRGELSGESDRTALTQFEKEMALRVFRIIESTLQMGITPKAPCYETGLIWEQMQQTLDVADVILQSRSRLSQ